MFFGKTSLLWVGCSCLEEDHMVHLIYHNRQLTQCSFHPKNIGPLIYSVSFFSQNRA